MKTTRTDRQMTEYEKDNPTSIKEMFNSIAFKYDRTNAIMSFNLHKKWNRALIKSTFEIIKPKVILDLCCGTGAIAFEYLKKSEEPLKVYMLDFSERMLEGAQARAKLHGLGRHDIDFLQADAQAIPLLGKSVDCITIAYGIRNIQDPLSCFRETYRVLRPKGMIGILELTEPSNRLMHFGHKLYLRTVLPLIGKLSASNKEAYQYLQSSIRKFTPPSKIVEMLEQVGFLNVKVRPLTGGIATLFTATKP